MKTFTKIYDRLTGLRMTADWVWALTYFGVVWGIEAIRMTSGGWKDDVAAVLLASVARAIFVRVDRTPQFDVKITNHTTNDMTVTTRTENIVTGTATIHIRRTTGIAPAKEPS